MNIDIIPGAYNFISMICGSEVEARIYHGEDEICKTESEAREAAELLKALFEAKQEGKTLQLVEIGVDFATGSDKAIIDGKIIEPNEHWPARDAWQRGFDAGTKAKKVTPEYLSKSYPSDYQLRLECYAVDILNSRIDRTVQQSIEYAVRIVSLAKEQADKYPEQ